MLVVVLSGKLGFTPISVGLYCL